MSERVFIDNIGEVHVHINIDKEVANKLIALISEESETTKKQNQRVIDLLENILILLRKRK